MHRNYKRNDIVEVEWDDAAGSAGWHRKGQKVTNNGLSSCRSVGYFLSMNSKSIRLSKGISDEDDDTLDVSAIPVGTIKKMRRVQRASK